MRHPHTIPSSTLLSSRAVFVVTLGLCCLTAGCGRMKALREEQALLQKNVDINTETGTSLLARMKTLEQRVAADRAAAEEAQGTLLSRHEGLQQEMERSFADATAMATQVQALSRDLAKLSHRIDEEQQRVVARLDNLSATQASQKQAIVDLRGDSDSLSASLTALQSEQVGTAKRISDNGKEIDALARTGRLTAEAVDGLTKRTDGQDEQIRLLLAGMEEKTEGLARTQEALQHMEAEARAGAADRTQSERALREQSDELARDIGALQARYRQWQGQLASLQEAFERLRGSTDTLDDQVSRLQENSHTQ